MMKAKYLLGAAFAACTLGSCSDMLDTESDRYSYDPELNEKTDSMFYTLGALKAVQQSIDQYVLTNELRGDLAGLTSHASTALQELYQHNVSATNKYDSAYVYYRVINNCNYYIAHRDTTLATGANMVAMSEYAEAHALRAWAYLQLGRTYGSVPFYTDPLMDVGSIEAVASQPKKTLSEICDALAPSLERYTSYSVPNWGSFDAGSSSTTGSKSVSTKQIMVPVSLVLADLYLESGQYQKAVSTLFNYLKRTETNVLAYNADFDNVPNRDDLPSDIRSSIAAPPDFTSYYLYYAAFGNSPASNEVITYVPLATNKLRGTTTELPQLFGYNYYSTADGATVNQEYSITPTNPYMKLLSEQDYYYGVVTRTSGSTKYYEVRTTPLGDMRYYSTRQRYRQSANDTAFYYNRKFAYANVPLYRVSGVYLKLAEGINRMGYPHVAFAIIKDGLNTNLLEDTLYINQSDKDFLTTGAAPFFGSSENINIFNGVTSGSSKTDPTSRGNQAIHSRGCGYTQGMESGYQYATEVAKKLKDRVIGTTAQDTLQAEIDAVEDIICDEMALELFFEGSRFSDLCRLARHKNTSSPWGSNYGSQWLANKLSFKSVAKDLTDPANWYMPFR